MSSMPITLTTPALLFPAISLLLLVYANRFLAIPRVIRELHAAYQTGPAEHLAVQMRTLTRRVLLIRRMQILDTASLFGCVLCLLVLCAGLGSVS
jgi:hypothetical protein